MGEDNGDLLDTDLSLSMGGSVCVQGRRDEGHVFLHVETLTRPLSADPEDDTPPCGGASVYLYLTRGEALELCANLGAAIAFTEGDSTPLDRLIDFTLGTDEEIRDEIATMTPEEVKAELAAEGIDTSAHIEEMHRRFAEFRAREAIGETTATDPGPGQGSRAENGQGEEGQAIDDFLEALEKGERV